MKAQIQKLFKSPFVRNVFTVAAGTAAAQAVGIAFAPIITRIYGPEAFGILGTYLAIVTVLTPMVALCYPYAIVLPKKSDEANSLVKLSVYISFGVAILVFCLLIIFGRPLLVLVGAESISAFIFLIPLSLLFIAWLQILTQWLIRKKCFRVKAKYGVLNSLIINGSKALVGLFYPFASALVIMSFIGNLLHTGLLYLGLKKKHLPRMALAPKIMDL